MLIRTYMRQITDEQIIPGSTKRVQRPQKRSVYRNIKFEPLWRPGGLILFGGMVRAKDVVDAIGTRSQQEIQLHIYK